MKFGIDRLLSDPALRVPLEGRRVALLAHPASVTRDMTHGPDRPSRPWLPHLHVHHDLALHA